MSEVRDPRERIKRLDENVRCRDRSSEAVAEGDTRTALDEIRRAFEWNPQDDDSALLAAMMHFELGQLDHAAEMAAAAVDLRPFHPAGFNMLGVIATEAGRSDLARKLLEHARKLAPGFAQVRANLKEAKRSRREPIGTAPIWKQLSNRLQPKESRCCACILALPGEHDHIAATLESVEAAVGETVVLCLGIDPELLDIPKRSNLRVLHRDWNRDLAAAWNDLLEAGSGEWLLWLRAGETLKDPADLAECMEASRRSLYATVFVEGDDATRVEPRVIRNAPGLRFRGRRRIELRGALLAGRAAWGLRGASCATTIAATNFEDEAWTAEQRRDEIEWLKPWVEQHPDDFSLRLLRGRLRLESGDAEGAWADMLKAHESDRSTDAAQEPLFREESLLIEAQALAALERWQELNRSLRAYHRLWDATADTAFIEALAAKASGDAERAEMGLELSETLRGEPRHAQPLIAASDIGLQSLLGAARLDRGDLDGAEKAFLRVLVADPNHLQAALGVAGIHLAHGRWEACAKCLDEIAAQHSSQPEAWQLGGRLLSRIPRLADVTANWYVEATRLHPDNATLKDARTDALVRCGRGEEALSDEAGSLGTQVAAALSCGKPLPEVPVDQTQNVIDETVGWCNQWAAIEAYGVLDRALNEILRAEPLLPGLGRATADWLGSRGQTEAAEQLRQQLDPAVRS